MRDLEDLIRFERESTAVDFKAVQYPTSKHADLLSDIIAMANADVEGDRFLVLGVKVKRDGTRTVLGVPEDELRDPADYQQLVVSNIEPELEIDYVPVDIEGKTVAVVRISACENPPYLMRKDFGDLREGYGVIRKGTFTKPLARKEYDRFAVSAGYRKQDLGEHLQLSFAEGQQVSEIVLESNNGFSLPSDEAAERIQAILDERDRVDRLDSPFGWRVLQNVNIASTLFGGGTPYEQRSTETIKRNLENVKKTYFEHDLYHVYEEVAHRLQLYVHNSGERYLEDGWIRLRFPQHEGLVIADQIYQKPKASGPLDIAYPTLDTLWMHYPSVDESDDAIVVTAELGNVRHGEWQRVFDQELRLLLGPALDGKEVAFRYAIRGKYLPKPVEGSLAIRVVAGAFRD